MNAADLWGLFLTQAEAEGRPVGEFLAQYATRERFRANLSLGWIASPTESPDFRLAFVDNGKGRIEPLVFTNASEWDDRSIKIFADILGCSLAFGVQTNGTTEVPTEFGVVRFSFVDPSLGKK